MKKPMAKNELARYYKRFILHNKPPPGQKFPSPKRLGKGMKPMSEKEHILETFKVRLRNKIEQMAKMSTSHASGMNADLSVVAKHPGNKGPLNINLFEMQDATPKQKKKR